MVLFHALIEDPIGFFSRQYGLWAVIQIMVSATVFTFCGNPWEKRTTHFLFSHQIVVQAEDHGLRGLPWDVFTLEFKVYGMTRTGHQEHMLLAGFIVGFRSENMIAARLAIKHPTPCNQETHINRHGPPFTCSY